MLPIGRFNPAALASLPTIDDGKWSVEVGHLGSLGVVSKIYDELGLGKMFDDCISADEQVAVPPGDVIKALVLNIIDGRNPLYAVEDWASTIALSALLPGVSASQLNDTSLGRHLDRFHDAGGEGLFNAACMRVVEREGVSPNTILADTTSRIVFGEYLDEEEGAISPCHGHSKDGRPDLKQVMFGLAVSSDGVPLAAQVLSGNTSDKTWHGDMLNVIDEHYPVKSHGEVHYVGDSALVTQQNLDAAAKAGIVLTSRVPRTLGLADAIVLRAVYEPLEMEDLGRFGKQKNATSYEGVVVPNCELLGHKVQVGVFRSTPTPKRTLRAVESRRKKAKKSAETQAKRQMKKTFSCHADAISAGDDFLATHVVKTHADRLIVVDVTVVEEELPKKKSGRKPVGYVPELETKYRLKIEISIDEKNTAAAIREQSCFVLVHTGAENISARDMMARYKLQFVVERRFPFLKNVAQCEVFFVKTPHRLEALGYIMMLALLVWSVWERRIRRYLDGAVLVDHTTGMKKVDPTADVARKMLHNLTAMRIRKADGSYTGWFLTQPLHNQQLRLICASKHPDDDTPELLNSS